MSDERDELTRIRAAIATLEAAWREEELTLRAELAAVTDDTDDADSEASLARWHVTRKAATAFANLAAIAKTER